jgi:lipopolysaccharide assembly outer membrane protein LptD (OstA)
MTVTALICSALVVTNAPVVEVTGASPEKTAAVAAEKKDASAKPKRPARITSRSTYYDRKDGVAVFSGSVYVDDEQYQMYADKAYVFTVGTNELHRIVAIGNVALTAMNSGDIPFIMGYNMFLAVLSVVGVILADLAYAWVDPRVKLH